MIFDSRQVLSAEFDLYVRMTMSKKVLKFRSHRQFKLIVVRDISSSLIGSNVDVYR